MAIVTGGLGGQTIGYATAVRLVEEGCKVAVFDIKGDPEERAAKIDEGLAYNVDISDEAQVKEMCNAAESSLGPASILVNCAAYFVFKGIDAEVEDWQKSP